MTELVKGGQGRPAESTIDSAWLILLVLFLAFVVLLSAVAGGLIPDVSPSGIRNKTSARLEKKGDGYAETAEKGQ